MTAAIEALSPRFPHQTDYLEAVIERPAARGPPATTPDFTRALDAFRPDLHRRDGIEHLVVFPMYLQNASRDRRFEALIVRVPWPDWLAELESTRYDNPKFVPVTFVDHTAGYDSECAMLFPETVCVSGRPVNHFGGDLLRPRVGTASAAWPGERRRAAGRQPAARRRRAAPQSERLSLDAYMLWDLIHDRAHSHGDLPFDPFMIRQRSPYWMYSLEELRCDLTAFCEAGALQEGFALRARDVQYAILFDRLFRFPITGSRVRNYDGLGGQLLFAYLHKHGLVHWTDNRLTIEWDARRRRRRRAARGGRGPVPRRHRPLQGGALDRGPRPRRRVCPGDGRSRWAPAAASSPTRATRSRGSTPSTRDEFPLSMFYTQLERKLDAADPQPVAA